MANQSELWGTLTAPSGTTSTIPPVTLLQRWCSAWGDLLSADMALNERREIDDSRMANIFLRRALWESAIASYGRCAVPADKRKILFNDFVKETVGDEGMAVHERIMDWRHGHVAHRNREEFESVKTVLAYANGPVHPTSFHVVVNVHAGPLNGDDFEAAFQNHVKTVRDAVWEKKIFPFAVSTIDDLNAGRIAWPTELRPADNPADNEVEAGRLVINKHITTLGTE